MPAKMPSLRSLSLIASALLTLAAPLLAGESPGCSASGSSGAVLTASALPGTSVDLELAHGGLIRSYRLHLPARYDGGSPAPLWLHVHGYTGSARHSDGWTGLSELSDREGFVLVFPQGTSFEASIGPPGRSRNATITSWNDLACSAPLQPEVPACREDANPYPCPPECGTCGPCNWCSCHDDVGYIAALIDHLSAELCIDTDRVFASGYSNGGMFVHRLGCALGEHLAAVAPMHGYLARGFNCAAEAPGPSMLLVGGTTRSHRPDRRFARQRRLHLHVAGRGGGGVGRGAVLQCGAGRGRDSLGRPAGVELHRVSRLRRRSRGPQLLLERRPRLAARRSRQLRRRADVALLQRSGSGARPRAPLPLESRSRPIRRTLQAATPSRSPAATI